MSKKKAYEIENPEKCHSRREFNKRAISESQLASEHGLVEFDDIYSFLEDYTKLQPVPFLELEDGTSMKPAKQSTGIKCRKKLCEICQTPCDCTNTPDCEEDFANDFQTGWAVTLTQKQEMPLNPVTGKEYPPSATPQLLINDVRLDGKPAKLQVTRDAWKIGGNRIPIQIIPHVQSNIKGQMTLRLMGAVNDAYIRTANKVEYIAEAYGIERDNLYKHLTQSANMLRNKAKQVKRNDFLSRNRDFTHPKSRTELLSFMLAGKKVFGLFEYPSTEYKQGKLLELYPVSELSKSTAFFEKHFARNGCLKLTSEHIEKLNTLSDFWLDSRQSRNALPPELTYGMVCLYSEIVKQFGYICREYTTEISENLGLYLDQIITPLMHKIILNQAVIDAREITDSTIALYRFSYFPNKEKIYKYLNQITRLINKWTRDYEHSLYLWDQDFSVPLLTEQKEHANKVIKILSQYSSPKYTGLSFEDIRNSIFINMATVPGTGELSAPTDALGFLNIHEWGEFGINLHCLCHLVKGGLFSGELHRKPKCLYYENAEFFHEKCNSDYCYQCQFDDTLEMK